MITGGRIGGRVGALGATRGSVLWRFLIEAAVLTGVGGALGLAVGEAASLLMNRYSPLPAYAPLWAILVGVAASVGRRPRLRPLARLGGRPPRPIEALRYE